MKIKDLYTSICIAVSVLLSVTGCQQEHDILSPKDTASLTLYFNSPSLSLTRSDNEETLHLYYEAVDGKLVPYQAPVSLPATRAIGDGNTADGGGMADLAVFLVDEDDNIVAREKLTGLADGGPLAGTTSKNIYFLNLQPGKYTVYAYANTEGNDWFSIPADGETSFAAYKDALLKPLTTGAPTISGTIMPLTGKLDITVGEGSNSGIVPMLRPVGKLSVVVHNEKTGSEALSVTTPSMGEIFPKTGYVFKHDEMLPQSVDNPYHALPEDTEKHTVTPGSFHLVYETFLYETHINTAVHISMKCEGANYVLDSDMTTGKLNGINEAERFLVRLSEPINSVYMYLRLDLIDGNYQLEIVPETELDEKCFWSLKGAGNQQRPFTNVFYDKSLRTGSSISWGNEQKLSYSYGESIKIGGASYQLTYDETTKKFKFSNNGTGFQFFNFSENANSDITINEAVKIEEFKENETTAIPLTSIYRNQHIQLNIRFQNSTQ